MFTLHDIVFPAGSERDSELYVRERDGASFKDQAVIRLRPGEGLSTDTYFGLFPWQHWKRIAGLENVSLTLRGYGAGTYAVKRLTRDAASDPVLLSGAVDLKGAQAIDLTDALVDTGVNAIYLELTATSHLDLEFMRFETSVNPRRRVDLGLIITTFNRAEVVRDTISKLERFIAIDPEPELGSFSLTIVDNGRNLALNSAPNTAILPNPNLGGAGGFARGLSHLCETQSASHGCFMDDDAASEGECLLRARRLLAYARDERTAITAAMLRAETTFMMHEQGAVFEWGRNHRIISRKNGLDLRHRSSLVQVIEPEPIGYGGWWFFSFPIQDRLRFPYPMFVRGDDWLFSYLNDFSIESYPGLCSWQEGFENKISPVEQYLAFKAFLVAEVLLRRPPSRFKTLYFFGNWIFRNLNGYCYDRAAMNCEALSDVLQGPGFWERNAALGDRLKELRLAIRDEALQPVSAKAAELPLARLPKPESKVKQWFRMLALNGHMVPAAVAAKLVNPTIAVPLVEAPQPVFAFLRETVVYRQSSGGQAFIARRRTGRYTLILLRTLFLLTRLLLRYASLRAAYQQSVEHLCTKPWWDDTVAAQEKSQARPVEVTRVSA